MKKISTLLLSSLFSLSLLAYDGSRLSISTVSNSTDLKIEIDGRKFAMQDNSVTLSNIAEGYHQVKIFREKRRNRDWNRDDDRNRNDDRNRDDDRGRGGNGGGFFGQRQEVIYASSVYIKRGFHTDITVNRFGKVFVDEQRMDRNDGYYNEDDNNNGGGWNNGYGNVINNRDFEVVKDQIRKEWFENNKLEVAKYAYRKTVYKQNYYQLNDAFNFSISKDDLARFISESR